MPVELRFDLPVGLDGSVRGARRARGFAGCLSSAHRDMKGQAEEAVWA